MWGLPAEKQQAMLLVLLLSLARPGAAGCPSKCRCYTDTNDGNVVECRKRDLTRVPSGIDNTTTTLFLDRNRIEVIPPNTFTSLPNLRRLDLHQNLIRNVSVGALSGLGRLRNLDLSFNCIGDIKERMPPNLTELYLDNNPGLNIRDIFNGLYKLRTLSLNACQLNTSSIKGGVFMDLGVLYYLHLSYNNLTELPIGAFKGLRNLGILTLDNNQLAYTYKSSFEGLESDITIYLQNNRITRIPEKLPKRTCNLQLSSNQITSIRRNAFPDMRCLFHLSLTNNRIKSIRRGAFRNLQNAQSLTVSLSGNLLSDVPDKVFQFSVRTLDLSNNKFNFVPSKALQNAPNLRELIVDRNPIEYIQNYAFQYLSNLQTLHLNNLTNLTFIDRYAFLGLSNLKNLYLENNKKLICLVPGVFLGLINLELLDLQKCSLINLPNGIFKGLDKLNFLYLSGNPWTCDCNLRWLKQMTDNSSYQHYNLKYELTCRAPPRVAGRAMYSLRVEDFSCPATITYNTPSQSVLVGQNMSLVCNATGEGNITTNWTTPDGAILQAGSYFSRVFVQYDNSLAITNASYGDSGNYTCYVENISGNDSATILIQVRDTITTVSPTTTATPNPSTTISTPVPMDPSAGPPTTLDPSSPFWPCTTSRWSSPPPLPANFSATTVTPSPSLNASPTNNPPSPYYTLLVVNISLGIAIFLIIVIAAYCSWRRRRRQHQQACAVTQPHENHRVILANNSRTATCNQPYSIPMTDFNGSSKDLYMTIPVNSELANGDEWRVPNAKCMF
ncbi:carboxypeptidase N subunit 2-like [Branchiostoma lanceolatum]|uniref:carboxypeptidase N subunit 2-like n=1 Tax=Branchiostoma lanceolatum TaxID=7740 RepID=UPI00345369BA